MSTCYHLCDPETKTEVWIGQGSGVLTTLYTGEPDTVELLTRFLREREGKPLFLLDTCAMIDASVEYKAFE